MFRVCRAIVITSLLATATSSLSVYPHELVYFNEFSGGAAHGHHLLLHSNLDWGQGLIELSRVLDTHPEWGPVAIAYSGPIKPEAIGIRCISIDFSEAQSPLAGFRHVAISANVLARGRKPSRQFGHLSKIANEFECFFANQLPVHSLDYSILLFSAEPYNEFYEKTYHPRRGLREQSLIQRRQNGVDQIGKLPSLAVATERNKITVPSLLHILLLYGFGETGLLDPSTGVEAFKLLTNEHFAKSRLGASPLIRTRHGLRYRLADKAQADGGDIGESHRDQCLGVFSTLDIPRDTPIVLESHTGSLKDLLSESIANFTFEQREIAWTAQAYAKYVAPAHEWTDRFGKTTTFSQLVQHLMDLPSNGQSCAGTHTLCAVIEIVNADYRCGILDPQTRINSHLFIQEAISCLIRNQSPNGGWGFDWNLPFYRTKNVGESQLSQVIVTGHLLEALHSIRPSPPPRLIVNSTRWMRDYLTTTNFETTAVSICPLTHAIRGLEMSFANRHVSYELNELFNHENGRFIP